MRSRRNARHAREPRWIRTSKRWSTQAKATPRARNATKQRCASESPSIRIADKFIGRKKAPTNAGKGRIFRAKIDIPKGETAANRTDIEVLFDGLPEPIDLELDLKNRFLYWTDRGDPPRGNTVNRAPMDADFKQTAGSEILLTHLEEGIGIALDFKGNRMFLTDLAGSIYSAKLDGSEKKPFLVAQGNLTGIAYAEIS